MSQLNFQPNEPPVSTTTLVLAGVAVVGVAVAVMRGPQIMAGLRKSLLKLGLSSEVMARSLAFGFVFGTIPLYVPTIPTIALSGIAKVLGLSIPASIIGLNVATPFFMAFMVPFIRAGEWLAGMEALAVDGLMAAMKEDIVGAFSTFGSRLLLAMAAWACAAPILLVISYLVFRPVCKAVEGGEKK